MINAYLTDDITVVTNILGVWGEVSTHTDTVIKGRFEFKTKMVRNLQGEMVVSTGNVIIPVRVISHKDKIIYNSVTYSILGIEEIKDFSKRFLRLTVA